MVGWTAPSATIATTVRLEQHQRKSSLPPRAQHVHLDLQHQKEKETQLASLVLLENFKIRTQTMKKYAQTVELDSTPTALTR